MPDVILRKYQIGLDYSKLLYLFYFYADIAGFNDCFNIVGRSVELEASVEIVMKARPT